MQKNEIGIVQEPNGDYILVCVSTGEQIGTLSKDCIAPDEAIKRVEIIKKEQREYNDTVETDYLGEAQTFKPYSCYCKENLKALQYLQKNGNFSKTDWEIYNLLKSHIAIISNYIKCGRNKYITAHDICDITGLSVSTVYKCLKKLKALEVIADGAEKDKPKLIFNPYIAYKGIIVKKKHWNCSKTQNIRNINCIVFTKIFCRIK